ncbi:MAG: hypothetical protein ACI4I1_10185 [Oscillospiraceae bacterium]
MNEKVYSYCGDNTFLTPMLWRSAFISEIFGMKIPGDMEIHKLSPETIGNIQCEKYSEALAHLLILFGAGYVDEKTVERLAADAEKYTAEIMCTEDFVIEQADAPEGEQVTEKIIQNILLCMINAKKYDEIQETDFDSVRQLCESKYTTIKNGFVYVKDRNFMTLLINVGEPMGYLDENDELRVLTKDEIANGFSDEEKSLQELLIENGEKVDMPFLLNLNNTLRIMEIYGKSYSTEFIDYAKRENIPFDKNFSESFTEYVRKNKLIFDISAISRKRKICGNKVNWFDYCTTKNTDKKLELNEGFDISETIDLSSTIGSRELPEEELLQKAIGQFLRKNALEKRTVIEITHCGRKLLYVYDDNGLKSLSSDEFRKVPFDYNNVWTTIMEWSRNRKIKKQGNDIIVAEEEWEKIAVRDRVYAQRMIEEQYSLQKSSNKMLQKMSELKAYVKQENDIKAKKAELEKNRLSSLEE